MSINTESNKIKVVLFSGGRGASNIIKFLSKHEFYNLSVIVNGYDDGLSTGEIRKIHSGMLGPSDFRKTVGTIIKFSKVYGESLSNLLEYRISEQDKWSKLEFTQIENLPQHLVEIINNLPYKVSKFIIENLIFGMREVLKKGFDPHDFALGNIIISSLYLKTKNFNEAIKLFQNGVGLSEIVYNVSNGLDLKLIGITDELQVLNSEAAIVSQKKKNIRRIFLVRNYLSELDLAELKSANSDPSGYLETLSVVPEINPKISELITQAELIIYGPGTPNSSLFPTYLTNRLGTLIAKNSSAKKIWVCNILKDNDISDESVESLFKKMVYYFNLGSIVNAEDIVNVSIIQKLTDSTDSLTTGKILNVPNPIIQKWDESSGKLHSAKYLEGVVNYFAADLFREKKFQLPNLNYKTLTIIVPVLDEYQFINKTLDDLLGLDLLEFGVICNILVVDSASQDGTTEIVSRYSEQYGIKSIHLSENLGIGHAINIGIESVNSDYTIIFPSDAEYDVDAIYNSIQLLKSNEHETIFCGSRNMAKYAKNRGFLKEVYNKNFALRLFSRIGGVFITLVIAVRIGSWITDPLTSVKASDTTTFKKLKLVATNFSYHGEIVRKAHALNVPIQEFPINYSPRNYKNGKKIRIRDGFLIILAILGLST